MNYSAEIKNSTLYLLYNDIPLLKSLTISANFMREKDIVYIPTEIKSQGKKIEIEFSRLSPCLWIPEVTSLLLTLEETGGALHIHLKLTCNSASGPYNYNLAPFFSANLNFEYCGKRFNTIHNLTNTNLCWQDVGFKNPKDIEEKISCVTADLGGLCASILPVVNKHIAAELANNGLQISTRIMGVTEINSPVMSINLATSPKVAISGNISAQKNAGIISVPLKNERRFPKCFEGFGWCTWDAFYHDVTADKIIEKLEEFRSIGISPKWLLIDDGWSQVDEGKLVSFYEDRQKFPGGLKELIKEVKAKYGIKYVGVWHAYTGYWDGIKPDSELAKKYEGKLLKTASGKLYPAGNEQYTYEFWAEWYTYLKAQGVDFVKTDNQSSIQRKCDGLYEGASGTFNSHSAHDRAVNDYFGGAVINCMGFTYEDVVSRPITMVSRNSDDFFPDRPNDFCIHTIQNVYPAVLHDNFYNCDYDMFFSKHPTAIGSAVLRAISGGPTYVSDKIGGTDKAVLEHLCTDDGETFVYDNAATVTDSCFFTDCVAEKQPLKVYNKCGENVVLAAFGVSPNATASGTITLADIPHANDKYLAHDFFQDKYFVFDKNSSIPVSLDYNGYALYTLYPIAEDGTVSVGDKNFYAEGATPASMTANYKTFLD